MNIKPEDAFIYVLNIAGVIVANGKDIKPRDAVEQAGEIMMLAQKFSEAWHETHDEAGNFKNPFEDPSSEIVGSLNEILQAGRPLR
jgi:hypothetical protein